MSWGRDCSYADITELEDVLVIEEDIWLDDSRSRSHHDLSSGRESEISTCRDMVRMDVCIEDISELESQFSDELQISVHLTPDRIDDECLSPRWLSDEIGVGRALLVKELIKNRCAHRREERV